MMRITPRGRHMTQTLSGDLMGSRNRSRRITHALVFGGALLAAALFSSEASAQALGYAPTPQAAFPSDNIVVTPNDPAVGDDNDASPDAMLPERFQRAVVNIDTREAPGTIIIDTGNTSLYLVLGQGRAIRYGVGVGRQGFTWAGTQTISRKAEWPDWHPPTEMIERQPYLPRFMAGGPGNPLGARAMYLGSSEYRIHGTNDPTTIGKFVSSGCIRLTNEDVSDLFSRVDVGTKVIVLPKNGPHIVASVATPVRAGATPMRPVVTAPATGRQAMNISTSSIY